MMGNGIDGDEGVMNQTRTLVAQPPHDAFEGVENGVRV